MSNYISLHNHSIFSIMSSIIKPADLFKRAAELEMDSIAVTDDITFAGIYDSYKVAKNSKVKLIVGCKYNFVDNTEPFLNFNAGKVKEKPTEPLKNIVLLAMNGIGYKNLLLLNRKGFDCKQGRNPLIDWELLDQYSEGVICLTGDCSGILGHSICNGNIEKTKADIIKLKNIYQDNLALELIPNNLKYNGCDQFMANRQLKRLSEEFSVKPIAASNARYLYKEQHKILDLVMAIKSGRSLNDRTRPRFEFDQLYLHTADDIIRFFKRNFGEDFAKTLCENTLYFADKTEKPNWVKPEFVTGDKSQLPTFPVKDDEKFEEFRNWQNNQSSDIRKLNEDQQFMRFKCEENWDKYVPKDKEELYKKRLNDELVVFEQKDFSSYMLITADFLDWARKNDVPVGPGRGCLIFDTLVLTENGFKKLGDIKVGEKVYTHTGQLQNVINKFEFDVKKDEKLLSIKSEMSFGKTILTKDHKVFGCKPKKEKVEKIYHYDYDKNVKEVRIKKVLIDPDWIEAKNLNIGDYLYTTFPKKDERQKLYEHSFDLAKYIEPRLVSENKITIEGLLINDLSMRNISREVGIHYQNVRRIKHNNLKNNNDLNKVLEYLQTKNITLNDWQNLPGFKYYDLNRYIPIDNEFLYVLGLWVGDGCRRNNVITFSFNSKETNLTKSVIDFFTKIGAYIEDHECNHNCHATNIVSSPLGMLFEEIFPNYKYSSYTKHLPKFFRELNNEQLVYLLKGVIDSDGSYNETKENIKTTSYQLACELKECFNKLHTPCAVLIEKANNHLGRNNATSYLIRFSGIFVPLKTKSLYKNGYYSKITEIIECENDKVYDITVENDNSYLTSSGVVHNSVGGSLVAYLLSIHKADPIKYGLIFERFLNVDKLGFPDIDVDISSEGRDKVLNYVSNKYGIDFVAHVSNYLTFTPKVAITDVITSLEIGGSRQDAFKIAKNITESIDPNAKSLKDSISSSKLFAEFIKEHPEVLEYSEALIGLIRSWATHAAGVIIAKYSLPGLVPLRLDDNNVVAIEYEKERAEENGLVKMDFLGLETLNIIKNTYKIIKSIKEIEPPDPIPLENADPEVYNIITSGNTLGVFQLGGSAGTAGLCNMIEPKNIEDIAVINALARPGVPGDIKLSYINRRFGKEEIDIPHPNLKRAVEATLGYCIFEESFMYLAHDFCGWDLQKSDKMRKISKLKAKGKHILEEMKDEFIASAVSHSKVQKDLAKKIWDEWVIPLSGYAFNKSHSILYSMTSFNTAYLKAYYKNEFLVANLISETNSNSPVAKDNILKLRYELRKAGVTIKTPNINESVDTYKMLNKNTLITGFSALHGVKSPASFDITNARPFASFEDLLLRTDSSKVRAPTIQAMAACGALDCFGLTRKSMYLYCSDLRKKQKIWLDRNPGKTFSYNLPKDEWSLGEIRALEAHYLGEAFSGTKQDSYPKLFSGHRAVTQLDQVINLEERTNIVVEGEVIDLFTFKVKKQDSKIYGQECCKILIEDMSGAQVSAIFFPDKFKQMKSLFDDSINRKFEKGFGIRFSGSVSKFGNDTSIIAGDVYGLFEPIGVPQDLIQKKIDISLLKNKKSKDITKDDVKNDLLMIIEGNR